MRIPRLGSRPARLFPLIVPLLLAPLRAQDPAAASSERLTELVRAMPAAAFVARLTDRALAGTWLSLARASAKGAGTTYGAFVDARLILQPTGGDGDVPGSVRWPELFLQARIERRRDRLVLTDPTNPATRWECRLLRRAGRPKRDEMLCAAPGGEGPADAGRIGVLFTRKSKE